MAQIPDEEITWGKPASEIKDSDVTWEDPKVEPGSKTIPKQEKSFGQEQQLVNKEDMRNYWEIAKDIGHVYPVVEFGLNFVSQYGVPVSGFAGLLTSPLNYVWKDTNKKVVEAVQKWMVYEPQTERGKHLTNSMFYPFEKLNELGEQAGDAVLKKTNSPLAASMVHGAIVASPAAIGLRKIGARQFGRVQNYFKSKPKLTPKVRAEIFQEFEEVIKANPEMSEAEMVETWNKYEKSLVDRGIVEKVKAEVAKPKEPWEMTKGEFTKREDTIKPDSELQSIGTKRIGKDGYIDELREVPVKDITMEEANKIRLEDVKKYKEKYSNVRPVLMEDAKGKLTIDDGHHRIIADIEQGKKTTLAWVRSSVDYPRGATHSGIVQQALSEGKPVPPEVLAEYGLKGKDPPGVPPKGMPPEPPPSAAELNTAFERHKDVYFGDRDVRIFEAKVEARMLQKQLKDSIGLKRYNQSAKDIDAAIKIYRDTKRNPGHVEKYYDKLTEKQKRLVDLSQELPEETRAIVDAIEKSYKEAGVEALDAKVIRNMLDNFDARVWDIEGKAGIIETYKKFFTKTRHAKQRVFDTVIEGWAKGYELKVEGAINNLRIYKEEIIRAIENKKLLKNLEKIKDVEGNPLVTDKFLDGYKEINHPDFTSWKWTTAIDLDTSKVNKATGLKVGDYIRAKDRNNVGKVVDITDTGVDVHFKNKAKGTEQTVNFPLDEVGKLKEPLQKVNPQGKNFFIDEDGNVFERRKLYAPAKEANNLNNIFGVSRLKGIPPIDTLTKYNAISKAWILQTSLFHHLAFMRSYYLGINKKYWSEANVFTAYKQGIKAIEQLHPDVELGVRNGLTFGLRQDWQEAYLQEKTFYGKVLDKSKTTKQVKDTILKLREMQAEFLFGEFGAGLKAKAFLIELRNELKKHPNENPDVIAKRVAGLVNDDFGGLHLERLGRDPTLQHLMQLILLAPDWTESNVRTMVKMFPIGKDGSRYYTSKAAAKMYRKFWTGVLVKGMGATALANYLLAGGDFDEFVDNYKKAWKSGNLKVLGVDVTPIYKALGGDSPDRKYFTLIGHFKDPIKFVSHPVRSLHHKGSVAYGVFHEGLAGTDWAGRKFTTFEELLHMGQTVKWGKPGGSIEYDQFPSYVINELIGLQPIQIQNLLGWMAGEQEGFDAVGNSLGLGITTARTKSKRRR